MNLETYYKEQEGVAAKNLQEIKDKIRKVSTARIVLFVTGCLGTWQTYHEGAGMIMTVIACTLVPFLILIKYHNRLFLQKAWWTMSIRHFQQEQQALQRIYTAFENGEEWTDNSHPYTSDLNVFGEHSLFQAINRTCTAYGKETLSQWFRHHLTDKEKIEARQQAIKELAEQSEFREQVRITGLLNKKEQTNPDELSEWLNTPSHYNQKHYRQICRIVPCLNLALIIAGLTNLLPMSCFWTMFGGWMILSTGMFKRITVLHQKYYQGLKIMSTYAQQIALIEELDTQSPLLNKQKQAFTYKEQKASEILNTLAKRLDKLDLRNNQILFVLLEGSMLWQVRQMIQIEQWKETYKDALIVWLAKLGEWEALCSMGTFAFNHPDYTYPHIQEEAFTFQAKAMGHPLMPKQQCVLNDANILSRPFFMIITGANMAGKSTYLRTVGSNYLLACLGMPVCCSSLSIYPAQLMTSLCISDSLANNESYFFAELKRLKQIIDRLQQGEEMFVILDEILRGTNSKDKQKGSFAFMQQLVKRQANGMIATHDLALGKLAEEFPNAIKNYCFEADIKDDQLTFSYKLREGISQNMNACFLMQKMGLIIDDQPHSINLSH